MKFYIEIALLPEAKINAFHLWSKLFTQIHIGLASIKEFENGKEKSPIGISFPEYFMGEKFGVIGSKLRLFARNESDLHKFDVQKWLVRLSDYIHVSNIQNIPQEINGYAIYDRYQPKMNKERLMRRNQKRINEWKMIINDPQSEPEEKAVAKEKLKKSEQRVNNYDQKKLVNDPFVWLKSISNGNDFCLWIKKTKSDQPVYEKFSTYGLSSTSTVPEF